MSKIRILLVSDQARIARHMGDLLLGKGKYGPWCEVEFFTSTRSLEFSGFLGFDVAVLIGFALKESTAKEVTKHLHSCHLPVVGVLAHEESFGQDISVFFGFSWQKFCKEMLTAILGFPKRKLKIMVVTDKENIFRATRQLLEGRPSGEQQSLVKYFTGPETFEQEILEGSPRDELRFQVEHFTSAEVLEYTGLEEYALSVVIDFKLQKKPAQIVQRLHVCQLPVVGVVEKGVDFGQDVSIFGIKGKSVLSRVGFHKQVTVLREELDRAVIHALLQ